MIGRNTKDLLLYVIKENRDDPNDVQCLYNTGQKCLASDLPDGELSVLTCYSEKHRYKLVRKEPQIETSVRKAWRDKRD